MTMPWLPQPKSSCSSTGQGRKPLSSRPFLGQSVDRDASLSGAPVPWWNLSMPPLPSGLGQTDESLENQVRAKTPCLKGAFKINGSWSDTCFFSKAIPLRTGKHRSQSMSDHALSNGGGGTATPGKALKTFWMVLQPVLVLGSAF